MADSYLWFEHTDAAIANAFATADTFHQQARETYKAYQAPQNVAVNVAFQGVVHKVPATYWLVINGVNNVSVYSPEDFAALYELAT